MDSLQHITSLITDIPSWLTVLDEQNGQIGRRQAELARLSGSPLDQSSTHCGTSTPGLKNKGSTESLRPKANGRLEEEAEEAIASDENEDTNVVAGLKKESRTPAPTSPEVQPHSTPRSPRLLQREASSSKKESPSNILRAPTHPLPAASLSPQLTKRRKSKTSSLHSLHSSNSWNSKTPTHPGRLNRSNRTRSMIIVYYDSAVQEAFEKLVRYISTARNAMRRGKMAERMEKMKMLAELEDGNDGSEEEQEENVTLKDNTKLDYKSESPYTDPGLATNRNTGIGGSGVNRSVSTDKRVSTAPEVKVEAIQSIEVDEPHDSEDDYLDTAKLQFKSTRMMGPGRSDVRLASMAASSSPYRRAGAVLGVDGPGDGRPPVTQLISSPTLKRGMGIGNTRNGEESSIYDDLDKSLEWCQSTCERAAHRFLRDGECYSEIAGVRKRLEELAARAQTAVSRLEEEEKDKQSRRSLGNKVRMRGGGHSRGDFANVVPREIRARELRSPHMRKSPIKSSSSPTPLASPVDSNAKEIEVDEDVDEGVSDMDIDPEPPKLIFRSARAGGVVRR